MPQGKSRLSAAELNLSLATSAGECARGYFVINHGASKTTLLRRAPLFANPLAFAER